MDLMEYQLKQSLFNIQCARVLVANLRRKCEYDGYIDEYDKKLIDVEIALEDLLIDLDNL